ncbi:MAG TPA: hypothetical protein VMU14_08020 [Acidimicrobiales bacterium]|nr:hypothetical protein [Acidimicrobiales bacterium]
MVRRRRSRDVRPTATGVSNEHVPETVVARAKAAFRHRAAGVYADLAFDSAVVEQPACREDRQLRFEHSDGLAELVIVDQGETCVIRGWAHPPPERAELELDGQEVGLIWKVSDGALVFRDVPHGLIRVRLDGAEGLAPVYTAWVRI